MRAMGKLLGVPMANAPGVNDLRHSFLSWLHGFNATRVDGYLRRGISKAMSHSAGMAVDYTKNDYIDDNGHRSTFSALRDQHGVPHMDLWDWAGWQCFDHSSYTDREEVAGQFKRARLE